MLRRIIKKQLLQSTLQNTIRHTHPTLSCSMTLATSTPFKHPACTTGSAVVSRYVICFRDCSCVGACLLNDIQDVSANGDNIAVYVGGKFGLSGGTSAATPIFSSIVNRIIEARLAIGKGPLGFLNPALYANPWVLNDITNGTNPGCGTNGFSAVKGWDPVRHPGVLFVPRCVADEARLPGWEHRTSRACWNYSCGCPER